MIAVVDYKAGNLTSVMKALATFNVEATVTADPALVLRADKIILPGVGHFAATRLLAVTGLTEAVRVRIAEGIPFLGICVGLQWLFSGSTEAPDVPGLGAFPEPCRRFEIDAKVPHVGWNSLTIRSGSRLMKDIPDGAFVYYTHSYRVPVVKDTVAVTEYGEPFTGAVERDNVMGVQFHPEKSGIAGMRVLANFVSLS